MRFAVLLSLLPSLAFAWGFAGHRRLSSVMQDAMPANHCLRAWFQVKQTNALQDDSCDPDRWRVVGNPQYDPNEWPRHYLETDWILPVGSYPRDYAQVEAQIGVNNANKNGRVPWRVEQIYRELVAAFAAKNEAQILNRAFILSHYVTDSFSLLHDTKNYDPNGLHERWESDMLQVSSQLNGIASTSLGYYGTAGRADPKNNIFDIVHVGNAQVPALIQADVNTTRADGGHDEVAFYNQVRDLTARRWGDAVTVMSSLLWSAWAEGGAPVLSNFGTSCSRVAPVDEIVLKGFPVPGGFTHPDGGTGGAGGGAGGGAAGGGSAAGGGTALDGGNTGGSGGTGGSGTAQGGGGTIPFGGGGTGGGAEEPAGCGCQTVPVAPMLLAALVLWRSRRRKLL